MKAQSQTINEILEQYLTISIPLYQRAYCWTSSEVEILLEDIQNIVTLTLNQAIHTAEGRSHRPSRFLNDIYISCHILQTLLLSVHTSAYQHWKSMT